MAERESLQSRLAYEAKCIENDVSSRSVHAILLEAADAIGVVKKLAEDMGRESVARRDRLKACIDRLDIRQDEDGSQHDEIDRLRFAVSEMQRRAETAECKLDTAERALERHGYRRSCDIPACNCGDQWNHGGHAADRLREISDEVYTNGKTVLQAVKDLCAERDRYRNALELLRPGIEIDLRYADPDDDIDALRSRAQTIREALSDE